jgi:glycosyltransferase involved in cell wall biosynthesis
MLLGMAGEIRRLGIPVVCSLSGEDIFLEKLVEPFHSQARQEMQARAGDADAYVALNDYYACYMAEYLNISRERIDVVPHGLKLDGHAARVKKPGQVFTIGYFARICRDKGLHQLVEAFEQLTADASLPKVRLRVAGYLHAGDKPYLERIRQRVAKWRDPSLFEYAGELDRQGKIEFLHSLDVMSVPTVYRESKGISILEALANAVPVIQPAHGSFPEVVQDTGGGLLTEPHNPAELAQALRRLVLDPAEAERLGRQGHAAVHSRYHADAMADATLAIYRRVAKSG